MVSAEIISPPVFLGEDKKKLMELKGKHGIHPEKIHPETTVEPRNKCGAHPRLSAPGYYEKQLQSFCREARGRTRGVDCVSAPQVKENKGLILCLSILSLMALEKPMSRETEKTRMGVPGLALQEVTK